VTAAVTSDAETELNADAEAKSPGLPLAVSSAATAVVSGVTLAVIDVAPVVAIAATTEYSVELAPLGSDAVINSGAVRPLS
jgi:hypothetical protein